jgi:hypothetical protein
MPIFDLPTRTEFFDADDPQYPIALPSNQELEVVKTTVQLRYVGLPTEEIIIKHYVKLT